MCVIGSAGLKKEEVGRLRLESEKLGWEKLRSWGLKS